MGADTAGPPKAIGKVGIYRGTPPGQPPRGELPGDSRGRDGRGTRGQDARDTRTSAVCEVPPLPVHALPFGSRLNGSRRKCCLRKEMAQSGRKRQNWAALGSFGQPRAATGSFGQAMQHGIACKDRKSVW